MSDFTSDKIGYSLDRAGILVSLGCVLHCLFLPLSFIVFPALAASFLADEWFHKLLVVFAGLVGLFAFVSGVRSHGRYTPLFVACVGIASLTLALAFEDIGWAEKTLTVVGASIMASTHLWNIGLSKAAYKGA